MFRKLISFGVLLTLFSAAVVSDARGDLVDFVLEWTEATSFGGGPGSASATGTITLDDSVLLNPGNNDTNVNTFVTSFSITVAGATIGNGTWTLPDFDNIILETDTALDLSQELIGQPTSMDPWGTPSGFGGNFNIFALGPFTNSPPTASFNFTITTDNGFGDALELTSFRPVQIPEPSNLVCLGILGSALGARRRRRG